MSYIQWTLDEPQNSRMFSSWGLNYRANTEPQGGRLVTTLWRTNGSRGETPVATMEWGRGGAPGRIYISRQWFVVTDFLRLESVSPIGYTRAFTSPQGLHLKWIPDPRSHSLFLIDNCSRNYGRLEPIPEQQTVIDGRTRRIGFVLSFAGAGANLDPGQKEHILVTILLYRCLTTVGAGL